MSECGHDGLTVFAVDGVPYCTLCEVKRLRAQLAAAEAECDIYKSRCICELAHEDDEAEHECGWQVCGVCWNNACAAHKKVADQLQAQLAAAHKLLREAVKAAEDKSHVSGYGGQRLKWYVTLTNDWYEAAKKEVGDE